MPFEVGTMLLVLWGAAALGATAPAASAEPIIVPPLEADTMTRMGDLVVRTSMTPARTGVNTLVVRVAGSGSGSVKGVAVRVSQPGHPARTVVGRSAGSGRYEFPAVWVAASGPLSADVTITRDDGTTSHTACSWSMTPAPQAPLGLPMTPWEPFLEALSVGMLLALASALATWLVLSHRRQRTLAMGQR
jgi:hypothetical protein